MSARSDFLFTDAVSGLKYRGSGGVGGGAETDWHEHKASKQGAWGEHTQRSRDAIYCCHCTAGSARTNVLFPPPEVRHAEYCVKILSLNSCQSRLETERKTMLPTEKKALSALLLFLFSALKTLSGYDGAECRSFHISSASLRDSLARVASWFCHSRREADWVNWFRPI